MSRSAQNMKNRVLGLGVFALLMLLLPEVAHGQDATPPPAPVDPAVLLFEPALFDGSLPASLPDWIAGVEQAEGEVGGVTSSWHVAESVPLGAGRLWIDLNRGVLNENLVLSLVSERQLASDMIIQLVDADGLVVVSDLFGNIQSAAEEARTDTFVIPLLKYPSVTRIVIRRVSGESMLYGAALIPVVLEKGIGTNLMQALHFSSLLGDRLSPANELVRRVRAITGVRSNVVQQTQATVPMAVAPVQTAPRIPSVTAASPTIESLQGGAKPQPIAFGNVNWLP